MYKLILFIIALIKWCLVVGMAKDIQGKIVNCNYNTSSIFRSGNDTFEPSDIDPTLCTHLTYQIYFDLTPTGELKVLNELLHFDVGFSQGLISRVMELKIINRNLKVFAGLHFDEMKHEVYLEMAVNVTKMDRFIKAALSLMIVNKFDGLDLYWKFPSKNESSLLNEINIIPLLEKLKTAFKYFKFGLSISVDASTESGRISYNIPGVADQVDFINIMAYNFAENEYTNLVYNAPLRGQGEKSITSVIHYWITEGVPPSKLVLGLATFGTSIELLDPIQYEVGSPILSSQIIYGYNTFCHLEKKFNYTWDSEHDVPFILKKNQFYSYDNVKSIEAKVNFGNCFKLAGFMVSAIDFDDFRGSCGEKYPLLRTVNNKLHLGSSYLNNCFKNRFVRRHFGVDNRYG